MLPPIIPNLGLLIQKKIDGSTGTNHQSIKIRVNPMLQSSLKIKSDNMQISMFNSNNHSEPSQSAADAQSPASSTTVQHNSLTYHNNSSSKTTVPIITSVSSLANIQQQQQTPTNSSQLTPTSSISSPSRPPLRRRIRRKGSCPDDQAEQLTEMSVRGLNLFRYASISEGVYKCTECAKDNVQKTFKNKYSFQRHAFLYHEGTQRKVFPCPMCGKEFSRPDKMKNHMKTTHECYMTKEVSNTYPMNFLVSSGGGGNDPSSGAMNLQMKGDIQPTEAQIAAAHQQASATMEYLRQQSVENSLQLQMIGLNSALSLQMPKLESLLPTTQ